MACVSVLPTPFPSSTKAWHDETQISVGKTGHSENGLQPRALWINLGYACDWEKAIRTHFDARAPSGDPTKWSVHGYYGIRLIGDLSVTRFDRFLR